MSGRGLWETQRFGATFLGGTIVVFLAAAVIVVLITRSAPVKTVAVTPPITTEAAPPPALIVTDGLATRDRFETQWLTGTVVNNTPKAYSYVEISYNLYDSSGAQIGTAMAHTTGLQPHGQWLFKTVIDDKCADFKLAKLDGS